MQPKKIVEWVKETAQRGRAAGTAVEKRKVSWEINGRRYRTRKMAIEAGALHAFEAEIIRTIGAAT